MAGGLDFSAGNTLVTNTPNPAGMKPLDFSMGNTLVGAPKPSVDSELSQTPFKVTSDADLAHVKPGQMYVNAKGMYLRKADGHDVLVDDSPIGITTQPLPGQGDTLPAGAYRDANGIIHNRNVPGWLDTVMAGSQKAGKAVEQFGADAKQTAAGIGHSLTEANTYKKAPLALATGFGEGSTGLERAAGQTGKLEGEALNHPLAMARKIDTMGMALTSGNLQLFKMAAEAPLDQFGAKGGGTGLGNQAAAAGQKLDVAGQQGEEYYRDLAERHGLDEASNQAWGKHATALGELQLTGEQLPQIAATAGASLGAGKLTLAAIRETSPELARMAAAGLPKAVDAVNRAAKLGSSIGSASTQTLVIAGAAGAEAHDRVMAMDPEHLMQVNPAFAARVKAGEDPAKVQAEMADVAANKAQILGLAMAPLAMGSASRLAEARAVEGAALGDASRKMIEGGVNNALTQGAIQLSVNEGAKYGDPTIQPFQGVAGQAFGGGVVGAMIEGVGAIGSHAEAARESRFRPDAAKRAEEAAALKRAGLKAQAKAGLGDQLNPDLAKQGETIQRRVAEGNVERAGRIAGRIAGTPVSTATADSEPADLRKGAVDVVKDAIKKFYLQPNQEQQNGPDGKLLSPEAQMATKRAMVQSVARWATMNGGRTPQEYAKAMQDLASTGELRDDVAEATKDQFNANGTLTAKALEDDLIANPGLGILHARPEPKQVDALIASLRHQGINPYVTPHGDVAVVGAHDVLAKLQEGPFAEGKLTSTITENHYGQAFHQEGAGAEAGAAAAGQGPAEAHEAAAQRPAGGEEGGPGADVTPAAQAQVEPPPLPSARAQPVTEALARGGVQAPVGADGRVTVAPDHPEASKVAAVAANDAATGENERKVPTEGQMRNGNYPKGRLLFPSPKGDLKVNIESPAGSVRRSLPGETPTWSRKIVNHYGYIPGTFSRDGEPVDAIVGRHAHDDSLPVFVVHQTDPATGKFDELKVVLGAKSEGQAMAMYKAEYPQALHQKLLQGTPKVVRMDRGQFDHWVKGGEHDVPINPMSRQPMLKLRDATGKAEVSFDNTASRDDVANLANSLNAKLHTTLAVEKNGEGYRITGDIPKAKMPALDRSARRIDGHQETTYDGQDVRTVFAGRGEADRNGIPERSQEPVLREAPAQGSERGGEVVPRGRGQEGRGSEGQAQAPVGERLYDIAKDPEGIIERAERAGKGHDKAAILYAVHRAGYDGVTMPGGIGGSSLKLRVAPSARRQRMVDVPGFGPMRFDQSYDVEELGGSSKDGSTFYADRDWNPVARLKMLDGSSKDVDRSPFLGVHELVERKLEDQGEGYTTAHREAQREENDAVTKAGIDWKAYQESYDPDIAAAARKAKTGHPPPDIVPKPYEHPHSVREREALARVEQAEQGKLAGQRGVSPEGSAIEQRFAAHIGADREGVFDEGKYAKAVEAYRQRPDSAEGRIISTDVARELSPDYLANRTLSADVHEPASQFTKRYYADRLREPHGPDDYVLFTAGGTGAGKTSALRQAGADLSEHAQIIYDTNMNRLRSSEEKINQALASGRQVRIAYVYREPEEALVNGALPRAERQRGEFGSGRTVPLQEHYNTHVGAQATMRALAAHYEGDPRVQFVGIDNSRGAGNAIHVPLDLLVERQHNEDLMQRLRMALDEEHAKQRISPETYHGFREVPPNEPEGAGRVLPAARTEPAADEVRVEAGHGAREGADGAPEPAREGAPDDHLTKPPAEPEAAARTEQELAFHVKHLQAHADKLVRQWKGAPEATVVRDESELPPSLRSHLGLVAPEQAVDGVIYGDHAYLIGKNLQSREHVERVLTHEVMGHYGLQRVFGDRLDGLLDSVHASIKDKPAFQALAERYGPAYAGMSPQARARAITEEFLSDRAELKAEPKALGRLVAAVRSWARSVGMVRHWTENDVLNLMHGVARDVREGRVSRAGLSAPDTTFDQEGAGFTSTYRGAAGEGTIHTDEDGSRQIAIGGFTGTARRTLLDDGTALELSKVALEHPDDALVATRLAGEEGKTSVLFPPHTEAALRAARVPYEHADGFLKAPASRIRESEPRYSIRASAVPDPGLAARIDRVLERPEADLTPWDRMQRWFREVGIREWASEKRLDFVQRNIDQLVPIAKLEQRQNGGTLLDASESGYKLGWMAGNTRAVMNAVLNKGIPIYKDGGFEPVAGRKGLLQIFSPLYTGGKPGAERMWEFYAIARRADQLQHQVNPDGTSKEKLLTPEDIRAGLALEKDHPEFKQVFDDWQSFNHHLLDLAVSRGNMTKEMADLWKQNDYVPFYRVAENGEETGGLFGGLKVGSRRLTGSNAKIQPLIENILGNTQAVLRKVYLNEALRRTAAIGDGLGIERIPLKFVPQRMTVGEIENRLEKMGLFVGQQANAQRGAKLTLTPAQQDRWATFFRAQEPDLPNTFKVMENGKPQYFRVDDPHLMSAIGSMQKQEALEKWFRLIFSGPKNFLTHAITLNPAFMLRHLERQMTHTFVQSGENFNPFKNAISSSVDAYTNSDFMQRMQMAGAGGNEYYDLADPRKAFRGMGQATVLSTGKKLWQAYRKIGFVADQMNRMSIAKSVLERGGSTSEAAWQAQDLLNFGMHGNGMLMRHLVGAVPFLNARVQGLYRIARGAEGVDQSYRARSKAVRAFIIKSAMLVAASQALALHNNGDPRYERLPDEAKDLYWHLFIGKYHYAIAKPFEIGAIFSTLPDRMIRYAEGLDGSGTFKQSLWRVFDTVFRLDPTPALVNPIIQDKENKDDLTQRPIVNESLQGIDPSQQFNPYTSPTIKAIAQHMPDWAPDFARSPLRLQHMIDGYVGTLGLYAQQAADAAVRATSKQPPAPAPRLSNRAVDAVMGSMVTQTKTDPRNRFEDLVFQQKAELDTAAKTIKEFQKDGAEQQLEAYAMKHKTALEHRNDILAAYRQMEGYRRDENAIYASPTMTSQQKRIMLDKIAEDRNAYLGRIAPLLNLIDSE